MTCGERKQIGLEDILITSELSRRSPRTPDLQAENQALHTLARQLAQSPQSMLKTLVGVTRDLCEAGTAGVSLLEVTPTGESIFRWVAVTGVLEQYEQGTSPGDFSPCGVCLERRSPQLFLYPERYFTYLQQAKPAIIESLVIPLVIDEQPLGTIWIVSDDEQRHFDSEDVRLMTSLGNITAAALGSSRARQAASEAQQALHHSQVQMQSLITNMPGMVYRYLPCADGSDRFTFVSSGCRDLFEVEPSAALQDARSIWNQIHPDDQPSFEASVAATVENFLPWDWQGRIITPSGKLKGQGATFTVKLPLLKREDFGHLDESTSSSLIRSSSSLPLADLRVLLVDDDTDTRDLIAFILEQSGALVTSATSAASALQAFEQTNFDVLISDIGMPQMDGYMLMRQIRAMTSKSAKEVLAIALTAYAGEINQQQAIAAGFQRHITKPVEPEDLVKVIADLMKASQIR